MFIKNCFVHAYLLIKCECWINFKTKEKECFFSSAKLQNYSLKVLCLESLLHCRHHLFSPLNRSELDFCRLFLFNDFHTVMWSCEAMHTEKWGQGNVTTWLSVWQTLCLCCRNLNLGINTNGQKISLPPFLRLQLVTIKCKHIWASDINIHSFRVFLHSFSFCLLILLWLAPYWIDFLI